ncbi:NTP transferase domain-containing protein [bacterium]|nr:NTP transferase domain-containing protein [bacterium]
MGETIAMILAGGQGSRLSILSNQRAKPAVPFGGNYRIIDFVISNVMHSGIRYMGVMTQYKPYSLMAHIGNGEAWGFTGRFAVAKCLPPYVGDRDSDWYAGTADAIYQNLSFISRFDVDTVLVLSGDHIYHMMYGELLEFHTRSKADLTIATQPVPWEETNRFGLLKSDKKGRIEAFEEKPQKDPISNQANLGIYVFKRSVLEERLRADAANPQSSNDFGKSIIPDMIRECNCYAFEFPNYWRDVGTLHSFWEANMECLDPTSGLDLARWRVHTNCEDAIRYCTPAHLVDDGTVIHSTVGKGSVIRGSVINSVLFRGVVVGPGAVVRNSVIMDGARIGAGSQVNYLVADKYLHTGAGSSIGVEEESVPNRLYPHYLSTGLTLTGKRVHIPDGYRVGRNCLIHQDMKPGLFPANGLPSGSTLTERGLDQP